jgi:uncharacterized membrane protein YeaQ/YmgE (transglycosylase-associated protein family)
MGALLNPSVLLGILLSIAYASLFHLWTGRHLRDLLVFIIAALIGFAVGQWSGPRFQLEFLHVGQLYLFEASIGAWLGLLVAKFVSP